MTFGEYIQQVRKNRGLTQAQLARKAGVSTQYINDIELSKRKPGSHALFELSKALELHLDVMTWRLGIVPVKITDYIARLDDQTILEMSHAMTVQLSRRVKGGG